LLLHDPSLIDNIMAPRDGGEVPSLSTWMGGGNVGPAALHKNSDLCVVGDMGYDLASGVKRGALDNYGR